jgi:hypothetical protein
MPRGWESVYTALHQRFAHSAGNPANGSYERRYEVTKDVRQGCPLSVIRGPRSTDSGPRIADRAVMYRSWLEMDVT